MRQQLGTDSLITDKEYYNLASRMFKDIDRDDTLVSLYVVFKDSD